MTVPGLPWSNAIDLANGTTAPIFKLVKLFVMETRIQTETSKSLEWWGGLSLLARTQVISKHFPGEGYSKISNSKIRKMWVKEWNKIYRTHTIEYWTKERTPAFYSRTFADQDQPLIEILQELLDRGITQFRIWKYLDYCKEKTIGV